MSAKNREFKAFARDFLDKVAPHIRESGYVMAIAPGEGEEDVKIAVEIGYAILLGKPLIVFQPEGKVVAEKLLRIADKVIRYDMNDKASWERAQQELKNYMEQ